MNKTAQQVVVIGTGYVGLGTVALLAHLGYAVTGIDIDARKIEQLTAGHLPIYEAGLQPLLAQHRDRIQWRTTYEAVTRADVVFICVGTPPGPHGTPDLEFISGAARDIAGHLGEHPQIIVNKSTVPIGTGDLVQRLLEEHAPHFDEQQHLVVSNPEFLREGTALSDSLYPDRIVLGGSAEGVRRLSDLYAPLLEQQFEPPAGLPRPPHYSRPKLVQTTLESAEMIKYAANAFLALKISFANEIAGLCERVGADIEEVTTGIGTDERIGPRFLQAGLGWGGSCFGKDTQGLISAGREYSYDMPILQAAVDVNYRQRQVVIEKLLRCLKTLKGKRIAILGLAFKPNTDDLRDAPAHDLIQRLHALEASVVVHDPVAMPRAEREWAHLHYVAAKDSESALYRADAVVIATEWDEYRQLDWPRLLPTMRRALIIDARNIIREPLDAQVEQIGREWTAAPHERATP